MDPLPKLSPGLALPVNGPPMKRQVNGACSRIKLSKDVDFLLHNENCMVFDFSNNARYLGGEIKADGPAGVSTDGYWKQNAKRQPIVSDRCKYVNAYLACLYEAGQNNTVGVPCVCPASPANYIAAQITNNHITLEGPCFNPEGWMPFVVFKRAGEIFTQICKSFHNEDDAIELLSLMHTACYQYTSHQFASSLLLAWTVIESLLNIKWEEELTRLDKSKMTAVGPKRMEKLTGHDYTASVISQTMSLIGTIDDTRLGTPDKIRNARNKFAHALRPVTFDLASLALGSAAMMISEKSSLQFRVGISLSFMP